MLTDLKSGVSFETAGSCPLGRLRMAGVQLGGGGVRQPRRFGEYALVYTLRGRGWYWDERGYERPLEPGDLIVVFPEIAHTYGAREGETWDSVYLVFDGPVIDLWRREGLLDPATPVLHVEPVEYWLHRFQELLDTSAFPVDRQALTRLSRLQLLLAEILSMGPSAISDADGGWLARACAALDARETARVDWAGVSRELGMSYESFRKRFRKLAGTAPARYHASRLVERACRLLHETDLPVAQIADTLGYCDAFHFSRRFRQITGFSPTDFRQRLPEGR